MPYLIAVFLQPLLNKLLVQFLTIDIEIYKFYSIIELRIWLRITFDAASFNSYI